MRKSITIILALGFIVTSYSQINQDFIGLGNDANVIVSSSDPSSEPENTINGTGYELETQLSSRFLAHATLGFTMEEVENLADGNLEDWIDNQIDLPISNYLNPTVEIIYELYDNCMESLGDECEDKFNVSTFMWRYAWMHNLMNKSDKLRQRVAMALSEILVISDRSQLQNSPHGIAYYFDILMENAFGNYEDLLTEVTYNPAMAFYLTHFNNPKSLPQFNRRPDENYAREFMQLFTIGLYELNQDGSRKTDANTGLWIPTYDNDDITELAKIFTGLSGSKWEDDDDQRPVQFGRNIFRYSFIDPLKMYDDFHEPGSKSLIGNKTISSGQSGDEDISEAISHIFNHENVAPFISTRLIQRLIKSNPSASYIKRISEVFNDNGQGIRGDLAAVVKAILLDQEAMECYYIDQNSNGMLRNPMLRYTQLMIGLKAKTESDWFWNSGAFFQEQAGQYILSAPSVFNFYSPEYVPDSEFAYNKLVGPEFQILTSSTSSNYVNWMLLALNRDYFSVHYDEEFPDLLNESFYIPYKRDKSKYEAKLTDQLWQALAETPIQMLDYLDLLLANGQLTEGTKNKIAKSMSKSEVFEPDEAANYGLFMLMIDPDYLIMK